MVRYDIVVVGAGPAGTSAAKTAAKRGAKVLLLEKCPTVMANKPCLAPEILTARQVMTSPLTTISETASIEEAAKLMAKKKAKRLPVMNNDKLVGIITFTDIVFKVPNMLTILEELVRPHHRKY